MDQNNTKNIIEKEEMYIENRLKNLHYLYKQSKVKKQKTNKHTH